VILKCQQINKILLKLQKMQEKSWKEEKLADIVILSVSTDSNTENYLCDIKHIMMLPIKIITLVLKGSTFITAVIIYVHDLWV
jgi:hypothetical protein